MAGLRKLQLVFQLAVVVRNRIFSATKVSGEQQIGLETDVLFNVLLFYTFSYTLITFLFN